MQLLMCFWEVLHPVSAWLDLDTCIQMESNSCQSLMTHIGMSTLQSDFLPRALPAPPIHTALTGNVDAHRFRSQKEEGALLCCVLDVTSFHPFCSIPPS